MRLPLLVWLTARRLRDSWPLLVAASVGVLLAVTMMTAAGLASRALAEGGLKYALERRGRDPLNGQVVVRNRPLASADYQQARQRVEGHLTTLLGPMVKGIGRSGHGPTMPLGLSPHVWPPEGSPSGYLIFYADFPAHARLVQGRWPTAPPRFSRGEVALEVTVGAPAARRMNLRLGDTRYLFPYNDDTDYRIAITVVGLVEPRDPTEEFWVGYTGHFYVQGLEEEVVGFFVQEEHFFGGLAEAFPTLLGVFWWHAYLNPFVVRPETVPYWLDTLTSLEKALNQDYPGTLFLSALDTTLREYQRRLSLARVPLFLFTSLVTAVLLYYLFLAAGLLAYNRRSEAAVLQSRGATPLQAGLVLALGDGLLITVPGLVLGPLVAYGVLKAFPALTAGSPLHMTTRAFLYGASAAVVAVGVFVLTAAGSARHGIVAFLRERARPPGIPLIYRWNLDILALGVGGLLWWQVRGRGGFVTERVLGEGVTADPTTLLAPAAVLVACALLTLRLFPLLARGLARLTEVGPSWMVVVGRRIARDPFPAAALLVLVLLTTALGVFAATYSSTLVQARREQARYAIGGDVVVRILGPNFSADSPFVHADLAGVRGVEVVSPVYRTEGRLGASPTAPPIQVLAITPRSFLATAWTRPDFAEKDMATLLSALRGPSTPKKGIVLPEEATGVGVWVRPQRIMPLVNLWIQFKDAGGGYRWVRAGSLSHPDWTFLTVDLPERGERPLSLTGFFLIGIGMTAAATGNLALDGVVALLPHGKQVLVEGFEGPGPWTPLPNPGVAPDQMRLVPTAAREGRLGLELAWTEPIGQEARGIFIPQVPIPLPALASPAVGVGQTFHLGLGRHLVPVVVREQARFFPTLDPTFTPFMVLNIEQLDEYIRSMPLGFPPFANEFWLGLDPTADRKEVLERVGQSLPFFASIEDREAFAQEEARDPLTGAGWRGLGILALMALAGALLLGWLLSVALAVHRGRTDLALLRVMGFSRRQVAWAFGVEHGVVLVGGVAGGFFLGLWLARWSLGFLAITSGGRPLVPPPYPVGDATLLAGMALALLLTWAVAWGLSTLWTVRLSLGQVLREEVV
ncbi:MAG: hypothetical protein NZ951_03675 [Dehalococcoidia bacterium]|nr:hypothetical protein [Dehalococcoidia bacterium]MDW8120302.1 FtsX-like permease family protein [Chloroflexota bacterium]